MSLNALGGFRVMQVYDAAPFMAASGGLPMLLSQFALRPDALLQTAPGSMNITLEKQQLRKAIKLYNDVSAATKCASRSDN